MEESQQTAGEQPSYWTSVGTAGIIFGIILFALSLIVSYATINSEPTGSMFSPGQMIGILACLVGAFGGMLGTWHYAKEYDIAISLGRGALIGFLVGIVMVVIQIALGKVWEFVDPDMVQQMIDSTIANYEAMDMPEEQKQQMIDMVAEGLRDQHNISSQLLWGIPLYGILNLLTGMLGAKIFGKDEG
ncbi:DUF4199 domain-containing protein [Fodinibius saliphilus]|uniref:DUF4199 domain-containing protein n=1 Tax=Fodinibius saliphilus TaxID=1920650 RepID=UPI0011081FE1|nr:DUF4199 domain-containing protein [Fodinibius saliphilus]